MKKSAFNLNIVFILLFTILATIAWMGEAYGASALFTACGIVFLAILPSCDRDK